jgi:hypothetical protein
MENDDKGGSSEREGQGTEWEEVRRRNRRRCRRSKTN